MSPASYRRWAIDMVREGAKPRRELAACWRVEVIKGALGERFTSDSVTSTTFHSFAAFPKARMRSASFCSFGSSTQV